MNLDTLAQDEQLWWLVARSGGIVALVLVCLSVIWGLLLSSKYLAGGPKPTWLLDLHRFLGALSVIFTVIHLIGLYLDRFVTFTVTDLLVPFASSWRPLPVAIGIVAFWLLVAIQATSMAKRRLPRRLWRWVHLTSFLLLPLGLIHGSTAGSDATTIWYRLGAGGLVGLVTWLTAWRAWSVRKRRVPVVRRPAVAHAAVPASARAGT